MTNSTNWPEEVWLIATGPSWFRTKIPFDAFKLTVNDAVFRTMGRDSEPAVFSLDKEWVRRNKGFLAGYPGEKYLALPLGAWPDCAGIPGVEYLDWSHADGLSDDPKVICTGCHSGYGALNLAYLKGAKRIYLVGYDLREEDGGRDASQYKYWAANYHATLPQLKAKGVEVINMNPRSAIDAFPFAKEGVFA